jgi:hypothetical protein
MEVVSRREARVSLSTSLLTISSCLASAHLGLYDCLVTSCSVLFFSVNYWRRPTYGLRRELDIINTLTGLTYQLCICHTIEQELLYLYLLFTVFGAASFAIGHSLRGMAGTVAHSGVHLFGNIANFFMYKGLIRVRGIEPIPLDRTEYALCALVILAVLDIVFVGGWPPKWWPT